MLVSPEPFDPARSERLFQLSGTDSITSLLLPDLAHAFRQEAPLAVLSIRPLARESAIAALADGAFDVALGLFRRLPAGIVSEPLFEDGYGVVMRKGRSGASARLSIEAYLAADHLLVSQDGQPRGIVDITLEQMKANRRVVITAPTFFAGLAAASTSDLLLTLPRRFARRWAEQFGLAMREPPIAIRPFTAAMAFRSGSAGDDAMSWLRTNLRRAAAL